MGLIGGGAVASRPASPAPEWVGSADQGTVAWGRDHGLGSLPTGPAPDRGVGADLGWGRGGASRDWPAGPAPYGEGG